MLAYRAGLFVDRIGFVANTALRSASRPVVVGGYLRGVSKGFQIRTVRVGQLGFSTGMANTLENENVELLPGSNDHYGGVMVDMKEQMDPTKFGSLLRSSMFHWRNQGKRGIWIKLPIKLASLVHPAVEEGFWYHHAEAGYLMLVYWIPDTENTLPANATHRVGVGAFVMNDKQEVLAVQEKNGKLRGKGIWKFPTGIVDQGENIYDGAIREVKEETGIDTEFVEILAFRQSHKAFFEMSDLYFICLLRPLSFDIQKQDSDEGQFEEKVVPVARDGSDENCNVISKDCPTSSESRSILDCAAALEESRLNCSSDYKDAETAFIDTSKQTSHTICSNQKVPSSSNCWFW